MGKGATPRDHSDIFRRGPAAWNRWRGKNRSTIPDLNGLALGPGERELGPKHGGPIDLNAALLRGASLRSARLLAADLNHADLAGADLSHGRLNRANLSAANLTGARVDHTDLSAADMRKANLHGAGLRSANLTDADLGGANLGDSELLHARLRGSDLCGANLSQARCDYADFAGASLKGADLTGAGLYHAKNLTRAQLDAAILDGSTILPPHLAKPAAPSATAAKTRSARSQARPKRKAPARPAPVRGASRRISLPALGLLRQRASWVALAVLWTSLVIGVAMRQSSGAVPLLPQVIPPLSELYPTAEAPDESAFAFSMAAMGAVGRPVVAGESATASPLVFVALGRPDDVARPSAPIIKLARSAPATLSDAADRDLPVAADLRAAPLPAAGPDLAVEDIHPIAALPAVAVAPRKMQLAALKQAKLRPVARPAARRLSDAPPDTPLADEPAGAPLTLIVSLRHQRLDVYRGARLIETTEISSGMEGHETRPGVFSILDKRRYHHSNIYSNAPMPWMQRLTRSGTALHGGVVPGYPASHGCIRLPFSFAPRLFEMTERGMNVVVANEVISPVRIAHPNLPQPISAAAAAPQMQASLESGAIATDATREPPLRILVTRRTLRDRMISLQQALSDLGYLRGRNFTGYIGNETRAAIRAFQKANDMKVTGAVTKDLAAAIYTAAGKEEPPAGHLFVRQGYRRLFDAPIAFSDPDKTLGTHVFTSMEPNPGEGRIVWLAASLEGDSAAAALDRLTIPQEMRSKLDAAMMPGSTFIIGDLSLDTAILPDGDDFIVVAKEEPVVAALPQAAKQTMKQAANKPAASKRTPRRVTREARRTTESPRYFPRGLFSRW